MHPSHKVPWCLPNPPGQVFAFKLSRTWVSRLVRARSDQPNQWRRESQRQSRGIWLTGGSQRGGQGG